VHAANIPQALDNRLETRVKPRDAKNAGQENAGLKTDGPIEEISQEMCCIEVDRGDAGFKVE